MYQRKTNIFRWLVTAMVAAALVLSAGLAFGFKAKTQQTASAAANYDVTFGEHNTVTEIQDTIQSWLTGGFMADGDTLTVTGTKTGADASVTLSIPVNKRVIWKAELSGNSNLTFFVIDGGGVFDVAGGKIENLGNGYAIFINSSGNVTVSGGTVSAPNSTAINIT